MYMKQSRARKYMQAQAENTFKGLNVEELSKSKNGKIFVDSVKALAEDKSKVPFNYES